ncbi:MAG: glycosyltransferase family 87 protein [bacterium]
MSYLLYIALFLYSSLGTAILCKQILDTDNKNIYKRDFLAIYVLTRTMAVGGNISTPIDVLAKQYIGDIPRPIYDHPTPHPPTMGLLLLPLSLFDYVTAKWLWFFVEFVLLFLTFYIFQLIFHARISWIVFILIFLSFQSFNPITSELFHGQVNIPILFLLTWLWLCLNKKQDKLAGFLWGISILLKQITWPILFIFLFHKKYMCVLSAVITILTGYIFAIWIIGWHEITNNLFITLPNITEYYQDSPWNLSLWTIGYRSVNGASFTAFTGRKFDVDSLFIFNHGAFLISSIIPLIVLVISLFIILRKNDITQTFPMICGILTVINPLAWYHYFVIVLLPCLNILRRLISRNFPPLESTLTIFAFLSISPLELAWMRIGSYLGGAGLVHFNMVNQLAVPYFPQLLFFMPTIGVLILSFLSSHTISKSIEDTE